MDILELLDCSKGDNIDTSPESTSEESQMICQEGSGCDCRGCPDSG